MLTLLGSELSGLTHFRYRAARADGQVVVGSTTGESSGSVERWLTAQGLVALRITEAKQRQVRLRVSRREIALLLTNIATLVEEGVSLDRAVRASEDIATAAVKDGLREVRDELKGGRALSEAFRRCRIIVPPVVLGIVRAGERGSDLGKALRSAGEQMESEAELVATLRGALAYPLLILLVGLISTAFIGIVVVPRFAVLLADFGQELPTAARILIDASGMLGRWGWIGVVLALGIGVAWFTYRRTENGREVSDRWMLSVWGLGPVRHGMATARFCRALGAMLGTGVPMMAALEGAGDAASDAAVKGRVARARVFVEQGTRLTAALSAQQALSRVALRLLAVGEQSGHLGSMAVRAGELAARDAQRRIRVLTALLEPLLLVVFGGMVAMIAAILLQAVYALRPVGF